MNHQYHVLTPFKRFQHLNTLAKHLESFGIGLRWHLIFDERVPFQIGADWISTLECPPHPEGWFGGHHSLNWYAEHGAVVDGDRYCFLNDDDSYSPDFFEKIDAVDSNVLITSMERGVNYGPCVADPKYLKWCEVGGEQIVVTGAIFKKFRFGPAYTGDWDFINSVTKAHKPVFVPEAKVLWNRLDPTHWP
jgi:hypothetical protein